MESRSLYLEWLVALVRDCSQRVGYESCCAAHAGEIPRSHAAIRIFQVPGAHSPFGPMRLGASAFSARSTSELAHILNLGLHFER